MMPFCISSSQYSEKLSFQGWLVWFMNHLSLKTRARNSPHMTACFLTAKCVGFFFFLQFSLWWLLMGIYCCVNFLGVSPLSFLKSTSLVIHHPQKLKANLATFLVLESHPWHTAGFLLELSSTVHFPWSFSFLQILPWARSSENIIQMLVWGPAAY